MSTPRLAFRLVDAATTPGGLSPRMCDDDRAVSWKRALVDAGFQAGDRVVMLPADSAPAVVTIEVWEDRGWHARCDEFKECGGRRLTMCAASKDFALMWVQAGVIQAVARLCEGPVANSRPFLNGILFHIVDRQQTTPAGSAT